MFSAPGVLLADEPTGELDAMTQARVLALLRARDDDGTAVAVHGANCTVCGGDRIALMGPSGSGKTTLLHLISGLDEPTGGAITWPALGDRSVLRPGRVGVVFQSPSLMAPLDVLENVALPLLLLGFDRRTAANAARTALERLGLGARCILVPAARRG